MNKFLIICLFFLSCISIAAVTPVQSTITIPGTGIQVNSTTTILPATIYFEADANNSGAIYINVGSASSSAYVARLAAGSGIKFESARLGGVPRSGSPYLQLSSFYLAPQTSGAKAHVTYLKPAQ